MFLFRHNLLMIQFHYFNKYVLYFLIISHIAAPV